MLKSNDLIVNFYQYLGIDPLYSSFKNPLLRKMDKVTENMIVGKYNSPDDQSKFNGKHIQLTLGNNKNLQKAYSIYLYVLQEFIDKLDIEKYISRKKHLKFI